MNATAISMSHDSPVPGLDRLTGWLLFAFIASVQISIAVANVLLAATLVCWVALHVVERRWPSAPVFFVPLAAYGGMTLLSSVFSVSPAESLMDSKQLLLFSIVPLVYDVARGKRATTAVDVMVSVGAVSAALGIIQYGALHYDNLGQRPQGALTHYMTYSGTLMLVICAACSRLVFGARDRVWPALVMPALIVALSLTFTRSAWVGACAAVGLLLALKDLRLTALLPVVVAVFFAFAPDQLTDRVMSIFDLRDPTNRDRLSMVRTGTAMIASHPLTGVGPNMVPRVYAQYRDPDAVEAINPHLHNVPLQIAAERGLPALAVWVWFFAALVIGLGRLFRQSRAPALAAGALAAAASMIAAGQFEYNFGDSEFLMLFLVIVTLPFAALRDAAPPART